jgi:hypothetical protein
MRNSGQEKTIVEPEVRAWAKNNGFDLSVVDTSAVWNPMAGRYLRRQASESLPDLIGNWGNISVWIELKAPKKRSAINQQKHQRDFLVRKINQGCFACVTDGVEHLSELFSKWKKAVDHAERRAILINDLPVEKISRLSSRQDKT